jgi:hypothetical protein
MDSSTEVLEPSISVQLQRAEQESQVDIAKRYPRDLEKIKARVLQYATCDEETAKSCFYAKPVDNKGTIAKGPSIRLAELVAASFQNIRYGSRVIEIAEKFVTVQGTAFDLENNIGYSVEVKRSIWSEKGNYRYSQNLVEVTTKAASAIAIRDAIYKVVPMAIFNAELKKIQEKATGRDSGVPLVERVTRAIKYFAKLGIDEKKVLDRLELSSKEQITEEHLETLVGLKTGIEDKEFTVDEAFVPYKKEKAERKADAATEDTKNLFGSK